MSFSLNRNDGQKAFVVFLSQTKAKDLRVESVPIDGQAAPSSSSPDKRLVFDETREQIRISISTHSPPFSASRRPQKSLNRVKTKGKITMDGYERSAFYGVFLLSTTMRSLVRFAHRCDNPQDRVNSWIVVKSKRTSNGLTARLEEMEPSRFNRSWQFHWHSAISLLLHVVSLSIYKAMDVDRRIKV